MIRLQRLFRILWVLSKYRLDTFLHLIDLPWPIRVLIRMAPWHLFPEPPLGRGERVRRALEELGPVFVKFGQILSTRRDLLPEDMADALRELQDNVPAFDSTLARQIIERELRQPIDTLFARFDSQPLASASIAQVHAATLHSGREVVVKVIRPDIEPVIAQDIALMHLMASLLQRYWEDGRRLRPVEIVEDYRKTIFDELDMQREAANASQLRRNFPQSNLIQMPEVFWDYTTTRVMVMERMYGIPIGDIPRLQAAGVDMRVLAEKGVEIFFTQVFRDSFFHADMHPGNIFVDASNPADPRYIAIDFGIVGSLTPADQSYLARNLLAFFNRNYRQVAELHIQSGWVPAHTPVNEFEAAIRTVCEPIFEKPLKDISFGQFLIRLFQTARRFDMEVQPQLVLLQKTLLNVEGLGRQLYPELDLWNTAQPFLERSMRARVAPMGLFKALKERFPDWLEQTPDMPQLIHDAIAQVRHIDQHAQAQNAEIAQLRRDLSVRERRQRRYWLAAACVAGALLGTHLPVLDWLQALPAQSWVLGGLAIILLWPRREAG